MLIGGNQALQDLGGGFEHGLSSRIIYFAHTLTRLIDELTEFSVLYSDFDTRLYEIAYPQCSFGTYYASPDTGTLVWEGALDFAWLEEEALQKLPNLILGVFPGLAYSVSVVATLFLEPGEVVEFGLDERSNREAYRRLMQQPERLHGARYDMAERSTNEERWYAFTAENPRFREDTEITVQLPVGLAWSAELLRWAVKHHSCAEELEGTVDVDILAAMLTRIGQGPSA